MEEETILKKIVPINILIFSLLLIASINVGVATEDYVGVSEGDEYIWNLTVSEKEIEDFAKDVYGEEYWKQMEDSWDDGADDMGINDDWTQYSGLKIVVEDISSEFDSSSSYYYYSNSSYKYVLIEIEAYYSEDMSTWTSIKDTMEDYYEAEYNQPYNMPDINVPILDPDDLTYEMMSFMMYSPFMPLGFDWSEFVEDLNEGYEEYGGSSSMDFEATALSNGLTLEMDDMPSMEGGTIDDISSTITYNEKGVLSYFDIMYGTVYLAKVQLQTGFGDIPGYPTMIFLSLAAIGTLGLIIVVKKRLK